MRPICLLVCLGLALLPGGCLWLGGEIPPATSAQEPAETLLQAGDELAITVAGEAELSGVFSVKDDGTVRMELLGSVPVAGLSVTELQRELRRRLLAGYLRDPQVRVQRAALFAAAPPVLRPSQ
jgi:protein involved in polysaccharide export with SLBB domain